MIKAFQLLYKERKSIQSIQTEEQVRQIIKSELLDEFTHPRARLTIEKKYALALERINNSQLTDEQKSMMLKVYEEEYSNLSTDN